MGVLKKKCLKICVWNFFFFENRSKKFWNSSFFKKFSYPIVLFDDKYKFRMILAFIWYAYCPCRCKIVIFQKLTCQKLKNFGVKLNYFGTNLQTKYGSKDIAQSFYGCMKVPSWILDKNWIIRLKNRDVVIKKVHRALCTPPWSFDWLKSLIW